MSAINEERTFRIQSYGKSELAALYMPYVARKSAAETLRKWIAKIPGLTEALEQAGLLPTDRRYTPLQVKLIVDALGEP
ncbi:DUF4248 domain-containing protein [uncultured Bacteroides sp.]|uniref:DUF4248 domain-containing protein n=1 Tax=uncultured Bacteroides sp. TaxID=162156 RepID=UPI002AA7050C|nr:DUF4248 domain-containing protein [uncultured Bacteroides sp.]